MYDWNYHSEFVDTWKKIDYWIMRAYFASAGHPLFRLRPSVINFASTETSTNFKRILMPSQCLQQINLLYTEQEHPSLTLIFQIFYFSLTNSSKLVHGLKVGGRYGSMTMILGPWSYFLAFYIRKNVCKNLWVEKRW